MHGYGWVVIHMKLNRKQWLIIIMLAGLLLCSVLMEVTLSKVISESNLAIRLQAPSIHHFFGTDAFGRDVFVRTIAAANISILSTIVIVIRWWTIQCDDCLSN